MLFNKVPNVSKMKLGDTIKIEICDVKDRNIYHKKEICDFKLVYKDQYRLYLLCAKRNLGTGIWKDATQYKFKSKIKYKRKIYKLDNIRIPTLEEIKRVDKRYIREICESSYGNFWLFNSVGMSLIPIKAYSVCFDGEIKKEDIKRKFGIMPLIKLDY